MKLRSKKCSQNTSWFLLSELQSFIQSDGRKNILQHNWLKFAELCLLIRKGGLLDLVVLSQPKETWYLSAYWLNDKLEI